METIKDIFFRQKWNVPTVCPVCNGKLTYTFSAVTCENMGCPSKKEGLIGRWLSVVDVKGAGPAIIKKLAAEIDVLGDLYTKDIASIIGGKTGQNIVTELNKVRTLSMSKFLSGMNITDCGEKQIAKMVGELILTDVLDAPPSTFIGDGIGSTTANKFYAGLNAMRKNIDSLRPFITIDYKVTEVKPSTGCLTGKSFCFTGKMDCPRSEMEQLAIANGGEIKPVGKNLTYLVCADKNSGSSKMKKALQLGIEVISVEEFNNMLK